MARCQSCSGPEASYRAYPINDQMEPEDIDEGLVLADGRIAFWICDPCAAAFAPIWGEGEVREVGR